MHIVVITPQFKNDLSKISLEVRIRADTILELLKVNPLDQTIKVKKLKLGDNLWRARVGTHRLIYTFDKKFLILLRIRHRKDVYKGLK